jgi:RHS repeat-associated protein
VHDVSVEISTTTNMRDISGSLQGAGGVGGLLMAEELDSDGDTIASHYYAADGNGNITLTTSDGGSVKGAFRFSTKYMDHEVETRGGIYYYGYRHYSPELGRWLSRDPIGEEGGVNLYGMVGNDAVNLWDLLGLAGPVNETAVLHCVRCVENPTGPMKCRFEIGGDPGPEFDANLGPNNQSETPNDPYGKNGPLPPGDYDIKPKPDGPTVNTPDGAGGIDYRKGTPSITGPGKKPGCITTPAGTNRGGLRIHQPGESNGCVTCQPADNCERPSAVENVMNTYKKPKLKIKLHWLLWQSGV